MVTNFLEAIISLTLDKVYTETTLEYAKTGVDQGIELEFLFDDTQQKPSEEKVEFWLKHNGHLPFSSVRNYPYVLRTHFPILPGIASSHPV